ncbi:hypothetical protein TanjilG_22646 [Lupinus angustifolius]|uniref:Potassium transporter n=1 Tax=Lupinus angustifolius TaxID=3871 RepID=A0A4P1RT98_LUPAN|nr:hypothetical protein TanjilG_22646 [Lupinus angustifolius]
MPEEADNQINLEEEIDTTNNAKKDNLKLKDRKISWAKLRRVDSLNLEAGRVSMTGHNSKMGLLTTLSFAFQSIGIVYGDIGTSPLYVYASTFTDGIKNKDDILGVLSLIIYTIVLIPMLKYVFIVLWANDNGNGGAFALYSLICRHVKMSLIPNQQPEDKELSNYKLETPSSQMKRAQKIKHKLEGSHYARIILLLVTIMGTSMVIGDGILTPTISVLSAVSGISTSLGQDVVVGITIAILIVLFAGQRFGSEAMFADLGHFNVRSIQLSFSFITFPSILAAYIGQAAYLRKFPENVANTFYDSIPRPIYWPTFVVAVGASIIASQAMISGAFSIISQALSLGCFPTIKVVHTSHKHHGQVYIPEINYMFMIACIVVCAAFKTTEKISHAYGIAVVGDMFITTSLVSLIMLVIWKKSIWQVALFYIIFGFTELLYFSAQLTKFTGGGYLPLVSAFFLTLVMGIWHYVYKEKYLFELKNKVSTEYLREIASNPNISRVPGIGFLYTDLVQGIPPIFQHFIDSVPSIHSVIVFVSIKAIPVSRVAIEERYLFRQVDPKEYRMFRCVVRHGYNDVLEDPVEFELQLVQHLKGFIQEESLILEVDQVATNEQVPSENEMEDNVAASVKEGNSTRTNSSSNRIIPSQVLSRPSSDSIQSLGLSATKLALSSPPILGAEEEVKFIEKEMEKSVVHMLAEAEVVAHPNSSFLNKIVVNYAYSFLRKNFRQREQLMAIPRKKLLKVGMTYEI